MYDYIPPSSSPLSLILLSNQAITTPTTAARIRMVLTATSVKGSTLPMEEPPLLALVSGHRGEGVGLSVLVGFHMEGKFVLIEDDV